MSSVWLTPNTATRPYPYDLEVNGVGLLLDPAEDGQIVAVKAQPISASPTDWDYGSANPYLERSWDFKDLQAGLGQMRQPPSPNGRYAWADGLDLSLGDAILGPRFHREALTTTGSDKVGRGLIRGLDTNGVDCLFALVGSKIYKRVTDNDWTVAFDCTAPSVPQSAVRFKFAGATPLDGIWVGCSTGNLVCWDGATWSRVASSAGPPAGRAQYLCVVGDELWCAWGNQISKCEGDPRIRNNWSGPITIGDGSHPITWLAANRNELYVFKSNGVFSISAQGRDQDLLPGLAVVPDVDNGRNAVAWLDYLWVPFGRQFFKLAPGAQFKPCGTERLFRNLSPVTGRITAFAGHGTWFGYEGLWNEATETSHLLKLGTWIESEDGRLTDFVQFRDVHNGALASWSGKKITALSVAYMPSDNERLYALFDDGSLEWCYLPRVGPNPRTDEVCEFRTEPGYLYWPAWHGGYEADPKAVRGFSVYGDLDRIALAEVEYRTDPSGAWEPLVMDDGSGETAQFTLTGQRLDVPLDRLLAGRTILVRTKLTNGGDWTRTPQVHGQALHAAVRPTVRLQYTFKPRARYWQVRRDGLIDRRSPEAIKAACRDAVRAVGTVFCRLPWREGVWINFVDYQEILLARAKGWPPEYDLQLVGVEFKAQQTAGSTTTVATLTYGAMEAYTYRELAGLL